MNATDVGVVLAGAVAIAATNWWFFGARRSAAAAPTIAGVQVADITVLGGYDPATLRFVADRPIQLRFHRKETNPCSDEIVIPAFGVRRPLPANVVTTIDLPPAKPGSYEMSCGMGMLHGRLVVEGPVTNHHD